MKTESEFAKYFLEHCECAQEDQESVQLIATQYWTDLTAHLNTYFSDDDRLEITEKAAKLLANFLSQKRLNPWPAVVREFVQNDYWGHRTTNKKPIVKKTEEQKIFWKLFKYGWAFFQSMIVLKVAVYYFGLESAQYPEQVSAIWVWLFFAVSVSSLAYFAYRNRHDEG